MSTASYLYNADHTRLQLVKSVTGEKALNWLFLPGGPGVDSSSLMDLITAMTQPGNYWRVDLIFNGINEDYPQIEPETVYPRWPVYLQAVVAQFENPILVGHSFGGYLPLFCPKLETLLAGLVILNSIPTLKSDLFMKVAVEQDLFSLEKARDEFIQSPKLETMKALYLQEADYFFTAQNRAMGIERVVNQLQYCIPTEYWWYTVGAAFYAEINWVPQKIPTLIIGAKDDFITPFAIFEQDTRFHRNNIRLVNMADAGHFPWIEQPAAINRVLASFAELL